MSGAVEFHDQTSDGFLAQYASDADFSERLRVWTDLLASRVHPGMSVVDLGCGGGVLTAWAAARGARVLGVDGSAAMIDASRKAADASGATFLQLDLPGAVPGGPFDLVMASSLIEYLDDSPAVDAWLAGLVKPGGTLAISLPNRTSLYRRYESLRYALTGTPAYRRHVRRMSTVGDTADRFAAQGLAFMQFRLFAHRPALSRFARAWFPAACSENLFAAVFRKPL